MFGRRITLFKLFGFEVRIDMSWLIIAVVLTWSLAQGLFPSLYKDLARNVYWWMGISGAAGLFASVVFHELFHSIVARRHGLPMTGITLFIFGGVAEMSDEPPTAKVEFLMAIAGPLSSIGLSLGFYGLMLVGRESEWPLPVNGVLAYLASINGLLAAFNLVPAFPLDGGRVLRSALWRWKHNLNWATRISSQIGSGFGLLLIFLGVINIVAGNPLGGIWWFLIGLFLRNASQMSYQQLVTRRALEGEPVERFMRQDSISVKPGMSVEELVEDYILKYHYKMYPVRSNGRLLGCVTLDRIKEIPKEEWGSHAVSELARTCSPDNTIGPKADAVQALALMRRTGNSRLMVVEGEELLGVITLKDLLDFLSRKVDLEERV